MAGDTEEPAMPLHFDATVKDLGQARPVDLLTLVDEPPTAPVTILTPDLSVVSAFSDLVFRVGDRIVHVDFQSGPDPDLETRMLSYNALLHHLYGLSVQTVVVLLRPSADRSTLTPRVVYRTRSGHMDFGFDVLRLWTVAVETLLTGGLGTLPFATLGQLPDDVERDAALRGIVERLMRRILAEAAPPEARALLTAAYILAGLRIPRPQVSALFQGANVMRDSEAYLAILDEGRADEARRLLLRQGRKRFGEPTTDLAGQLQAIADLERLERLSERLLDAASWQDLLATP
jgi:hypothetical protein